MHCFPQIYKRLKEKKGGKERLPENLGRYKSVANGNVMFVLFAINNLEYIYDEVESCVRYISNMYVRIHQDGLTLGVSSLGLF